MGSQLTECVEAASCLKACGDRFWVHSRARAWAIKGRGPRYDAEICTACRAGQTSEATGRAEKHESYNMYISFGTCQQFHFLKDACFRRTESSGYGSPHFYCRAYEGMHGCCTSAQGPGMSSRYHKPRMCSCARGAARQCPVPPREAHLNGHRWHTATITTTGNTNVGASRKRRMTQRTS